MNYVTNTFTIQMHGFEEGDKVRVYGKGITDTQVYTVKVFNSNALHLVSFTIPKPLPENFYLQKRMKSDNSELSYGLDRYPYMWLTGGRATGCACCKNDGTGCKLAKTTETCTFTDAAVTVAPLSKCANTDGTGITTVDCYCGEELIQSGEVCNNDNTLNSKIDFCGGFRATGDGYVSGKECACCGMYCILHFRYYKQITFSFIRSIVYIIIPGIM